MASWNIYSKEGTLKYVARAIEYHEEWMVSDSVEISVSSPSPIDFEVGDYLTYRGLRYSIYSLPSTLKTSRMNTYGDGFKWEGVRFHSEAMRLTEIRFLDYVLNDNGLHYSSLPKFSFYAETVDDLIDRIQANADQVEPGWVFLTPDLQRTLQRYGQSASDDIASMWYRCYGDNGEHADLGKNVTNINVNVSNNTLSEGLSMVYNQFGMHYVCRDKVVIIGMSAMEASHVFKYGKGNGLYEIERVADQDQQIVTRLYAYGSDKNLPLHYYAELNMEVFATVTDILVAKNDSGEKELRVLLDIPCGSPIGMFKVRDRIPANVTSYGSDVAIGSYVVSGHVTSYTKPESVSYLSFFAGWRSDSGGQETDASDLYNADKDVLASILSAGVSVGDKIYFTSNVNKEGFPSANRDYGTQNLPNNMAINTLMLPGFPLYSLSEVCKSVYDAGNDVTKIYYRKNPTIDYTESNVIMRLGGNHMIGFSSDRYRPYIESPNQSTLGVKEGVVEFTEETDENGLQEVYPTIEGMTKGEVFGTLSEERLDEVVGATMIEDNGVFGDGDIPNFKITLKNLGFNLKDAFAEAGSSMTISMKDGYCGGRDFDVKSITQDRETGNWVLSVNRAEDSALGLYFPYSYHVSIGEAAQEDEPYQIRGGDHFVLTGIDLADTTYVEAASIRVLKKAISWLQNNDYMRYTYMPKVDEIFMARERDEAVRNGQTPLHDILKGGMLIHFQDTDLDIDSSIFIDSITIKEGDSAVPTYEIVLREEKTVSTLQRVMNQISNFATSGGGGGGGLTAGQVRSIVEDLTDGRFLRKDTADTAQGKITFADGAKTEKEYSVGEFLSGLLGNGGIFRMDADGKTYIEADKMYVRMKAYFDTVEVRKFIHSGGNRIASLAGIKCVRVECYGASGDLVDNPVDASYFRCYFRGVEDDIEITNDFEAGDLAFCKESTAGVGGSPSMRHYWREVIAKSDESDNDGLLWIDLSNQSGHCEEGSGTPQAQDDIIQLGNVSDTTRQGAIIEYVGGDDAPSYQIYQGIDTFSLEGKEQILLGYNSQAGRAYLNVFGDAYIGARDQSKYVKYDQQTNELDIKAKVKIGSTLDDGRPLNELGTQAGNLILNSGFTGGYESEDVFASDEINADTLMWSAPLKYWDAANVTVADNANTTSGRSAVLADGTLTQSVGTLKAGWYILSFVGNITDLTVTLGGVSRAITPTSAWDRYELSFEVSSIVSNASLSFSGTATLGDIMLTEGTISREWQPSTKDNNKSLEKYFEDEYLRNAIANANTDILGGLVLTQLIKVGLFRNDEMSQETGGMSGLYNTDNSPFLWGGGDMEKAMFAIRKYIKDPTSHATDEEVAKMAKFVVTHGGRAILNDVILRGYIYALGGVFKGMLDIGNGKFRVNEDGSASLAGGNIKINSNGDVHMRDVHAENGVFEGHINAKDGVSYGTSWVGVTSDYIDVRRGKPGNGGTRTEDEYTVSSSGFIEQKVQLKRGDIFVSVGRYVDKQLILILPEDPSPGQLIIVANTDPGNLGINTSVFLECQTALSRIVPGGYFQDNKYIDSGIYGGRFLPIPTNHVVQLCFEEITRSWHITSKFDY